ncbi:hypothetical protein [Catellatospora paridis]|uniref:hypothetical protein n=1 Tax=Catellatospora paridis TaxID=1617086 RepID=UPI0012D45DCC|nr:hypothetical protein [Catellatospora paridis]
MSRQEVLAAWSGERLYRPFVCGMSWSGGINLTGVDIGVFGDDEHRLGLAQISRMTRFYENCREGLLPHEPVVFVARVSPVSSSVNYVVVRDGEFTVYAQGGGAGDGIDYLFAPGPEVVLRWLAHAGDYVDDHWFDDVLCKGGVLIDVDRRILLLFNTTFNGVAYRAAMLQAYAATWSGWEIRWAYDGIGNLMAYVGLDPESARDEGRPELVGCSDFEPGDTLQSVVTIRGTDGLVRRYGLSADLVRQCWLMGPDLVELVAAGPELRQAASGDELTAGLHLDAATRQAGLWSVEPLCGLREQWAELWPGWTLEFWGDDLARQAVHDPDRRYGSIAPHAITRHRRELAERVRRYWPVRSTMLAHGVDVDFLYKHNFAGFRSHLDANVSAEEIKHIAKLLRGPKTTARQPVAAPRAAAEGGALS